MDDGNTALAEISKAQQALERANDIHEILDLRDKFMAAQLFANAQGFREAAQEAKIYQLKAERKAGAWLAVNVNHEGNKFGADFQDGSPLPDGIDYKESHRWQLEASLPEEKFNEWVDDSLATGREITARAIQFLALDHRNKEMAAELRTDPIEPPAGKYATIVIDPPWPMEKLEREARPNQFAFDYPVMSLDDIYNFDVPGSIAMDDCHLFLWTTQKFLPRAFDILGGWSFRYVFTMVWHKPGGFQPYNLPQYNCEFVVYARRGAPEFTDTKAFSTCFNADRNGHSVKPDEFYRLVERVCPGPRIEIFARQVRAGFDAWGNEVVNE